MQVRRHGQRRHRELWDARRARECRQFHSPDRGQFRYALAFTPDSRSLVAIDYGDRVTIWDAATGQEVHRFGAESTPARGLRQHNLTFTPDGQSILVQQMRDPVLRLLDAAPAGSSADSPAKRG